ENLREITGDAVQNLATLQDTLVLAGPSPANEAEWVTKAMKGNLALEASRLAAEIAFDDVDSRRASRYPTLELVASHNEFDSESDQINQILPAPPQASSPENDFSTTTIGLELRFPIYTGGFNTSRVREAVYLHRAAKERAERIARETERQTRDSYLGVLSEISRVNALKRAVESQQTALRATEAGLEVGTRTTVDVLISRQAYFNALTNYARSRYDYLLEVLRLKQAAGTLGEADLRDIEQWLKEGSASEQGQG
ncbi:MAG: TolC family protein, partial [Pseudomonadota bacterium]